MKNESISQKILIKFNILLESEKLSALRHLIDPYWTSGNTNVGNDELTAVNLMETIDVNLLNKLSEQELLYSLIQEILNLKKTYDLCYEDFDGYGTSTFNSVIIKLINYSEKLNVFIENDLLGEYLKSRDEHYELDEHIDKSLAFVNMLIYGNNYHYALDFIQIHLFILSLKLFKSLNIMIDAEISFFTKRFYLIRTILIKILLEIKVSPEIETTSPIISIYRYIIGCSNILTQIAS